MNAARGRDRRARGCARRLAADGRRRQRDGGRTHARAGREGAGLGGAPARPARARHPDRAGRGRRRRRGACCPRRATCSATVARARPGARDRAPRRATRSSPSSTPRVAEGVARRSSSRIPSSRRRTCRSRTSSRSRAQGALLERCFTTPHTGKVAWERWLESIRATGPEHSVLVDRPRPGRQPAGRGRAGADGGPAARGRFRRG